MEADGEEFNIGIEILETRSVGYKNVKNNIQEAIEKNKKNQSEVK